MLWKNKNKYFNVQWSQCSDAVAPLIRGQSKAQRLQIVHGSTLLYSLLVIIDLNVALNGRKHSSLYLEVHHLIILVSAWGIIYFHHIRHGTLQVTFDSVQQLQPEEHFVIGIAVTFCYLNNEGLLPFIPSLNVCELTSDFDHEFICGWYGTTFL